jgi:hypothetical protein
MNERVQELADQCEGRTICECGEVGFNFEKFAELIIGECLSIVNDAERGGSNEVWDNAVKFIRRDIKEHFGVEE